MQPFLSILQAVFSSDSVNQSSFDAWLSGPIDEISEEVLDHFILQENQQSSALHHTGIDSSVNISPSLNVIDCIGGSGKDIVSSLQEKEIVQFETACQDVVHFSKLNSMQPTFQLNHLENVIATSEADINDGSGVFRCFLHERVSRSLKSQRLDNAFVRKFVAEKIVVGNRQMLNSCRILECIHVSRRNNT